MIIMTNIEEIINKALISKNESKHIEFKAKFDINSAQDWCEIIKDIIALANSGGGVILIGIDNRGQINNYNISEIIKLDPANMTDKLFKYTGENFSNFEIIQLTKDNTSIAAIKILPSDSPIIFDKPGTYDVGFGKQKTAFSKGVIYFRHGAKSAPGTTNDIKNVIKREVRSFKDYWLNGIRKITKSAVGSHLEVLPPTVQESTSNSATPIRIVDDPSAQPYRILGPDQTHPYRQKEILEYINNLLLKIIKINSFDILSINKVYKLEKKRDFYYKAKFGPPQYSKSFVKWVIQQYNTNNNFFSNTRSKYKKTRKFNKNYKSK